MERYWIEELKARCSEICTMDANKPDMVAMVKSLCEDDSEIDKKDHSLVSETAKTLLNLSDR